MPLKPCLRRKAQVSCVSLMRSFENELHCNAYNDTCDVIKAKLRNSVVAYCSGLARHYVRHDACTLSLCTAISQAADEQHDDKGHANHYNPISVRTTWPTPCRRAPRSHQVSADPHAVLP